jgi:DNA-binding LacI/PurR family transcriptional regulator
MSLTQHELVNQLGISRGTLHRILTGSKLVKESTRERVLRELERMNYVPNAIARGLKTRRTNTIGIVGPAAIKLANIDKLNALHVAARKQGFSLVLGYSDGSSEEDANCIRDLRSRMVDGLIAMGRGLPQSIPILQKVIDDDVPLVTLYPIPGLKTDCVYIDTQRAFRELTQHLIKLGHSKIGLLLDASTSQYTVNRERGFREGMAQSGLKIREDWIVHVSADGSTSPGGEDAEKQLWKISDYQLGFWGTSLLLAKRERPTGLVCYSDEFAIGALRAADLAGVPVPSELALVGYDDKEPSRFARVPLTTMHQPDDVLGETAIDLLINRIEGNAPACPTEYPLEAKLVIRESCGAALKSSR